MTSTINLSDINGSNGFVINGIDSGDRSGGFVSSGGDVNGDGFDDVIIGAVGAGLYYTGESYVVFGSSSGLGSSLELSSLDGSNGFVINGVNGFDQIGSPVNSVGDINGDGFDDVIIGKPYGQEGYVVFGGSNGSSSLELSSLDGSNGFVIDNIGDGSTTPSLQSAGDINGDGFDDIIIGRYFGGGQGTSGVVESYVIFGNSSGFNSSLSVSTLDGSNGFAISGASSNNRTGYSVSSAGDINGDGFDDVILGYVFGDPNGNLSAGESYVIFGSNNGFSANFDLSSLDGSNGFVMNGIDESDFSGYSVSHAGDINGDGIDDIIIGALFADPNGSYSGESYVVFGDNNGFGASLDLSSLNGSNGFKINGINSFDYSGSPVRNAGDVNGDGFDDIIVGVRGTGDGYVIFGSDSGFGPSLDLSAIGSNGFIINTINGSGFFNLLGPAIRSAGDVNGDGLDDIIVGESNQSPDGRSYAGQSYVVFGFSTGTTNTPPDAVNDTANTNEDTAITGDVLTNDSDADNDPIIVTEVNNIAADVGSEITLASGALLTLNANGTYSYNPNSQFESLNTGETTTDSFTYTISDGTDTDTATVTVRIDGITDNNNFNIINGTSESDSLIGNRQPDFIAGNDGNDTLKGRGGDDILEGGSGGDIVYGNGGNDILAADQLDRFDDVDGAGSKLLGGSGNDTILGGNQDDEIIGGNHDDVLSGNDGNDTLRGSKGDDVLNGGSGDDRLQGDSGIDTVVYQGNFNDFTFSGTASNFMVTSATVNIGRDTVMSVEFLQFDDGLFATSDLGF